MPKQNLLFVCSRNMWRSPTAEMIFRNDFHCNVRSAGTSPAAKHQINLKDVEWADKIVCMEKRHKEMVEQLFKGHKLPPFVVLDIEDNYQYMDPELIELLRQKFCECL